MYKKRVQNQQQQILRSAVVSLGFNSLYALYHGVSGIIYNSPWLLSMCSFYSILAIVRFSALLCERRKKDHRGTASEFFVMKLSGLLLLLLGIVLAYIIYVSLSQHIATAYGTITMITIATVTFYKAIITAIRSLQKSRKRSPVYVIIRSISCAEVAAAVLTMQRSMLVSFGSAGQRQICIMNALTGAAACLFIFTLGIMMMIQSRKENCYGKIKTCENK